jgi:hypothetical protein
MVKTSIKNKKEIFLNQLVAKLNVRKTIAGSFGRFN